MSRGADCLLDLSRQPQHDERPSVNRIRSSSTRIVVVVLVVVVAAAVVLWKVGWWGGGSEELQDRTKVAVYSYRV